MKEMMQLSGKTLTINNILFRQRMPELHRAHGKLRL